MFSKEVSKTSRIHTVTNVRISQWCDATLREKMTFRKALHGIQPHLYDSHCIPCLLNQVYANNKLLSVRS